MPLMSWVSLVFFNLVNLTVFLTILLWFFFSIFYVQMIGFAKLLLKCVCQYKIRLDVGYLTVKLVSFSNVAITYGHIRETIKFEKQKLICSDLIWFEVMQNDWHLTRHFSIKVSHLTFFLATILVFYDLLLTYYAP